jgi:hypothetical protein
MTNKKKPSAKSTEESNKKFPIPVTPKPPMEPVEDPNEPPVKTWTFSIGIYPGILFGIRTYEEVDFKTHVLYLPFIDFALEIDN